MPKLLSLILLAATAAVSLFVAQPLQAATAVVQPHRTILDEGARLLPGNMVFDVAVRRRVAGGVGVRRGVVGGVGVRRGVGGGVGVRRGVVGGIGYWRRPIAGGYRAGYLGRPALGYRAGYIGRPALAYRAGYLGRPALGYRTGYMGRPALAYRAGYLGRPALGYGAGYFGRPALGYWAGERSMPAGMCPKKDEAIVILSKDPFCAAHHLSDDACQETWKAYWSETAQYNGFLAQCRMLHWPEHKS
jgi:hypothetical protein